MKKWSIILGLFAVTGAAACAGGGAFLVVYKTLEPEPYDGPTEIGVWHEPAEVRRVDTGTAVTPPEPLPVPIPEPEFEVQVTSDGPHPNVDIGLLSGADWSGCSNEHGTVTIMAVITSENSLDSALVMSTSEMGTNAALEQCVREVVLGLSTQGAPADYFMMSAQLTLP